MDPWPQRFTVPYLRKTNRFGARGPRGRFGSRLVGNVGLYDFVVHLSRDWLGQPNGCGVILGNGRRHWGGRFVPALAACFVRSEPRQTLSARALG